METMRLLFLLLTIWTIAAGSTWAQQRSTDQTLWARSPPPPPPPRPPPTLATLDLTVPASYPQFITNMRNIFSEKDKKGKDVLVCNMKKISETVPSPRYAYLDIKASATQTVTLAMDRADLYVLGYRDKFIGKDRAFFFKNDFKKAGNLFPDAKGKTHRVELQYKANYDFIGERTKVPLGIENFRNHITKIYGEEVNKNDFNKHQREFFLLALQMVSEATRFKEISDKIPTKDDDTLKVNEKLKVLENGWDKLSTAVYTQTEPSPAGKPTATKCKFKQGVQSITLEDQWNFKSVEEIEEVIGILKVKGNKKSENNDNDDDRGGVAVIASS